MIGSNRVGTSVDICPYPHEIARPATPTPRANLLELGIPDLERAILSI
jgi:hypothetical protein